MFIYVHKLKLMKVHIIISYFQTDFAWSHDTVVLWESI